MNDLSAIVLSFIVNNKLVKTPDVSAPASFSDSSSMSIDA